MGTLAPPSSWISAKIAGEWVGSAPVAPHMEPVTNGMVAPRSRMTGSRRRM